jgi:UDP-N-acetylmuramoylalanine--D-glutamate ligase
MNLNNKRIGIWGMGREGQAVCQAIKCHVLKHEIIEISEENISELLKCDVVVKSPGVSLYRSEIQEALQKGVEFTSSTNLFFANKKSSVFVIAVTGTKGKSTTSSLLAHTLKSFNKHVELGGNIGRPLVELSDTNADFVVAELSSYQCADLNGKPEIGVLLNLYPEHLQWHQTHDVYYQDKVRMIRLSAEAVLNATDPQTHAFLKGTEAILFNAPRGIHIQNNLFYDGEVPLFPIGKLPLIGRHNAENACAVLTVIKMLGLKPELCEKAFETFKPLAHRLEIIGKKDGITYVDDSISTTPETAMVAIKALDKGQDMTLIAGGFDRGQNYKDLVDFLKTYKNRIRLVTLPDTGKVLADLAQRAGIETALTSDMPTAVSVAQHITPRGGMIILSPAAPSYNMYPNFEERGKDFKKWVFLD